MKTKLLHSEISDLIIQGFYSVYNKLGYGFLEKVYEKSLVIELRRLGLECEAQVPIDVYYHSHLVGLYFADILVNKIYIIEIKVVASIIDAHEAQLLNYLKATQVELGLILNFGPKPDFKRKILTSEYKKCRRI